MSVSERVKVRRISIYTMFSVHSIQNKWHLLLGYPPSASGGASCVCWGFEQRGRPSQCTALEILKEVGEKGRRETTTLLFFFFFFTQLSSAYLKYLIMIQQYNSNRIAGLKANATVTMSFIFLPVVFIHLLLGTKSLNPFPNT